MPITPGGAIPIITAGLVSGGCIGIGGPKLALGVATGVCLWVQTVTGVATAVGTLGAGIATAPLIVPPPVLFGALMTGLAGAGCTGVNLPLLALGLSTGLSLTFAQGIVTAPCPTVGVGTAVIKFIPPPAVPLMIQGFATAAMVLPGSIQVATGIGIALTVVFTALVLPGVVAGASSPLPGAGPGVVKIL